jgi:NAD(P)-dependent dehydrogenase (short-subunit alcohol dehydrogenase family)
LLYETLAQQEKRYMDAKPIALITGAARGIGLACAEVLAENGCRVMLADINGAGAKESAARIAPDGLGFACDIGNPEDVEKLFYDIERQAGSVAVLANCAGISIPCDFMKVTLTDFKKIIDVNLTGTFLCLQRAARTMIEKSIKGSIVNLTSVNAVMAIPSIAPYCASKGGVMQLTKAAALALAPHGIRVNAVGPGSIDTAMLAATNANPDAMRTVLSRTPLKRIGEPREVAHAVAFLASEKASYITGETIYIDGGRMALNYTV